MTYPPQQPPPPQQPGSWQDPSWPPPQAEQPPPYADPYGAGAVTSPGYPVPPGYPPAYPGYGYGGPMMAPARTNPLAIAAMVLALCGLGCGITAPVGAIMGHVARGQIRRTGEGGAGMALAGIIVGWILTGLILIYVVVMVIVIIYAARHNNTTTY